MLKLKLQYFLHLMRRANSLENTLMLERLKAGGEGDDRGWDGWMTSQTWGTQVSASSSSWWWTGKPGVLQSMGSQRVRHDWATELNWMCTNQELICASKCREVVTVNSDYSHFLESWESPELHGQNFIVWKSLQYCRHPSYSKAPSQDSSVWMLTI